MALQKVIRVITGNSLLFELPQLQPRVCLMDNDLDNERYYFCPSVWVNNSNKSRDEMSPTTTEKR